MPVSFQDKNLSLNKFSCSLRNISEIFIQGGKVSFPAIGD